VGIKDADVVMGDGRIALTNALTLAWMLDRTLLVPPSTLGAAVDWAPSPKLQANIEIAERSIPSKCRKIRDKVERRKEVSTQFSLISGMACFAPEGRPIDREPSRSRSAAFTGTRAECRGHGCSTRPRSLLSNPSSAARPTRAPSSRTRSASRPATSIPSRTASASRPPSSTHPRLPNLRTLSTPAGLTSPSCAR